ncbi:TPA: hypothetical protein ACKP22_005401 [Pseudomonas putida]
MATNFRLLGLQDDLRHTARQIDHLCHALDGHARFLRHSVHQDDAAAMGEQVQELRDSAEDMREIAQLIRP